METLTNEIREFIDLARADTGDEQLERAWISAYRSFLSQTSRDKLATLKHRLLAKEDTDRNRDGEPWTESEIMLAMNPNYSYTDTAIIVGRTPESVLAARKRYWHVGRERLKECTDEIYGTPQRVVKKKPIRSVRVRENSWKKHELNVLRDLSLPVKAVAVILGRTPNAVTKKRSRMGLNTGLSGTGRKWVEREIALIESGQYSDSEIADKTGRTLSSVRQKRMQIESD